MSTAVATKRIDAGLYELADGTLIELAARAGYSSGGWYVTYPGESVPDGWFATKRDALAAIGSAS